MSHLATLRLSASHRALRPARILFFCALALPAAERKFELRGKIEPAPRPASVTLHGSHFPFYAATMSGYDGRFRFRNLDPGAYTLAIFVPGRGEVRRTVEVGAAFADRKGRIRLTVPFQPSGESLQETGTVSVRELTIPDDARDEYAKALKRLNQRDVEGARDHLRRAVKIAPNFVAAWNHLGTIAYQAADYESAEKYFLEALKHEPGAYSPVVNLGGTLLSLNRYQEALKYNQFAVSQRPDDALANSQMGMNYFFLGEDDKALEYLKTAKRLDPSHFSQPQLVLAQIYTRRGHLQAAIEELEDFLARHPEAPNAEAVNAWLEKLRHAHNR